MAKNTIVVSGDTSVNTIDRHRLPQRGVRRKNPAVVYISSLKSKTSRKTMITTLNTVARTAGGKDLYTFPWEFFRRDHATEVMNIMRDANKKPATINLHLSAIRGMALEAFNLHLIDSEDYNAIKTVKSETGHHKPKGRSLDPNEIRKLFAACEADTSALGIRDAAILSVLIGCGLRRAEIISLTMDSYSPEDGTLTFIGKGQNDRIAFLPPGSQSRMDMWINEYRGHSEGPLFMRIRRHGDLTYQHLSDQGIQHILKRRRIEAGLEHCSPHDLRRTCATTLLELGEDILTVRDVLGHASVLTTQRYVKRDTKHMEEASKKMDMV